MNFCLCGMEVEIVSGPWEEAQWRVNLGMECDTDFYRTAKVKVLSVFWFHHWQFELKAVSMIGFDSCTYGNLG